MYSIVLEAEMKEEPTEEVLLSWSLPSSKYN